MSDEKVLTKEIAEQFLTDSLKRRLEKRDHERFSLAWDYSYFQKRDSVVLIEFTAIEDEAAEILCDVRKGLYLDGLLNLSEAAAEALSEVDDLYLNGLTSVSDAAAERLAEMYYGSSLYLNGLTELSDAAAERLSKTKGNLFFNGLTSLSDAAAESLGRHEGALHLTSLTSLSDAAAESLSEHGELSICLKTLSVSATQIIHNAGHKSEDCDDENVIKMSKTSQLYLSYDQVPFYRRRRYFWLLWLFCTPISILVVMFGDVYYEKNGEVKTFGLITRLAFGLGPLLFYFVVLTISSLDASQEAVFHKNRGDTHYSESHYHMAIASYTEAIEIKPDYAEAYYKRAKAYQRQKEHEKAIADYTEAIRIKPDYAPAYNNRGNAYQEKGDKVKAEADYAKAKELGYKPEQ